VGRLALIFLVPATLLGILEGVLLVAGAGNSTNFFVKVNGGDFYTGNDKFIWQFYSARNVSRPDLFLLPAKKQPGAVRIFVLGESAAMGTPNPAFSFGRILEVMLRRRYPNKQFEVINAAMRGINSHVILPIARDCARHDPDLFIVYAGNNEVIGLHCPEPNSWLLGQNLALLRGTQWLKSTRAGQCFRSLVEGRPSASAPETHEMEYFRKVRLPPRDRRRQAVDDNFRANLEDVCKVARQAGAKVILSTVAVNLKDCPPLGSLHRADLADRDKRSWEEIYGRAIKAEAEGRREEALQQYRVAERLDDQFAELHFCLARCALAVGDLPEARREFSLARDWDALQFRADNRINALIRLVGGGQSMRTKEGDKVGQMGKASRGLILVDAEKAFAESELSEQGIPGEKLFREHVHPTFDGDYLLARTIYPAVVLALTDRLGPSSAAELPSRKECAEELAFSPWDEISAATAAKDLTVRPPFTDQVDHDQQQARLELAIKELRASFGDAEIRQALEMYRQAIERRPNDWRLRFNLGKFYQALSRPMEAVENFRAVVSRFTSFQPMHVILGQALGQAGQLDEAMQQFEGVLRIDPKNASAREGVAWVQALKKRQPNNGLGTTR